MADNSPRHFLTLCDLSPDEYRGLIRRAMESKTLTHAGKAEATLPGRTLAMVFEKSSTRTRVSFETGITQLGGHGLFLSPKDTQLGRGEPIEDTARVLSRMVDIIMIRTFGHDKLERFAAHSDVPVINGLTDLCHPCQLLADMQTYFEHRGDIAGRTVAWVGDGNNMCHSYMSASHLLGFDLRIAVPEGFDPEPAMMEKVGGRCTIVRDPREAVEGVDLVSTDVWTSMGQEDEDTRRRVAFSGFQVDTGLMDRAADDALFMHCLPAHRGEEVSAEMMDDPRAVVWDEAENRLHAQKALMELLMGAIEV
ncbi:MAG: ornithine carbamoyltransferase [Gammaproteobacteria bacterium]